MVTWIRWFDDVGLGDIADVGGKNASLGELRRHLVPLGVKVPNGFATTTQAWRATLEAAGLSDVIAKALAGLDVTDPKALHERASRIREAFAHAELPAELAEAIGTAYARLETEYGAGCDVAVRSSATAEDLPQASFAGQQETYLGVRGVAAVLDAARRCMGSLYTDRAIVYRAERGLDHVPIALSVGIQAMVRADLACAGVIFTIDTESGYPDAVLISGAWGLGESVVQGLVNPDEFVVHKPMLREGFRPILRRRAGSKETRLVYGPDGQPKREPVPEADRVRLTLSDDEVLTLARQALAVEQHYSAQAGRPTPLDLEWAKDGRSGELYIVQARPETVEGRRQRVVLERHHLDEAGEVIARGRAVGARIGQGPARVVRTVQDLAAVQPGDVLVAPMTDPDWEPVLARASAVVTDRGGRTCHAAIVSRELGIPAVVGTGDGTAVIQTGAEVTVSCAEGEEGHVYRGRLRTHVERTDLSRMGRPRTKIMMNLANPDEAFGLSMLPSDGVGLARMEFIISQHIGVHPMALVHPERVTDAAARDEIAKRTVGFTEPTAFFVQRLAEGVGMLAAAFHPRDVIVRLSDFKTNEYANLLGGRAFEPEEANPMIGFRGASRYYDERYREGFALECQALLYVRETMGLRNCQIMVPFCRTVQEGRQVLEEMARHGLVRGENGLQVWVMCEVPSNVVLADQFSEVFDGFSIGSNDLTQLLLGVDRDSALVARLFDERDETVLRMIAEVISVAHAHGRRIGICGQAPSDYPEFARFLVEHGIDSLSLNPDAVLETTVAVLALEQRLPTADGERAAAVRGGDAGRSRSS